MKAAGIIALLLIVMILATGCVDKAERDLNIKNNVNSPDSDGVAPSGTPLNQRISTIFNSFAQYVGFPASIGMGTTHSSSDRQSAYEELMKQMNEDPDSSQGSPSPVATQVSTSNTSTTSGPSRNITENPPKNQTNPRLPDLNSSDLSPGITNGTSSLKSQMNLLGDYSSFDSGITGWKSMNGTLTPDNSRPHDGTGDAKFVTSGAGNNFINYSVPSSVTAHNTLYTLSGWIATTSPGSNYLQAVYYAANGTILGVYNGTNVGPDDTYRLSTVTFTTPPVIAVPVASTTSQGVHVKDDSSQIVTDEAATARAVNDHIDIRVVSNGAGTSYIDSIKLELGSQATNYVPQVDFSRIQKYPDYLELGQIFTYGSYGQEKDVSVYRYRMKTSFGIQYKGRYGPVFETIEAPTGQTFVFLYVETRYNGTEKMIDSPPPGAFTIVANNMSYSPYTVDPSLMTDNQDWDNAYTIHDEFVVADYNGGILTPGSVRQGMIMYLIPSDAYYHNMVARLGISQFSQWWKTPRWRLGPVST